MKGKKLTVFIGAITITWLILFIVSRSFLLRNGGLNDKIGVLIGVPTVGVIIIIVLLTSLVRFLRISNKVIEGSNQTPGITNLYVNGGLVVGRDQYNTIIINIGQNKIKLRGIVLGSLIIVLFSVVQISLIFFTMWFLGILKPEPSCDISGFGIAVAGFNTIGGNNDAGNMIGQEIYEVLERQLEENDTQTLISICGPNNVGTISGNTLDERSQQAATLAEKYHANVVLYGVVDTTASPWVVTPEFFVWLDNSYEAQEIVGNHRLGGNISYAGYKHPASRLDFSAQIANRLKILTNIVIGLDYYFMTQYDDALEYYSMAEELFDVEDGDGKEVLYLLKANTQTRLKNYSSAEEDYRTALEINPDYSRAMIGIAGSYYLKSLSDYQATGEINQINIPLIMKSIEWYQAAMNAKDQPPLADIMTKAHQGMGQCYLMLAISGDPIQASDYYEKAISEFNEVVLSYGEGSNPRVKELAGEAHGRLGLIYRLAGENELALAEYSSAANLLVDYPERYNLMIERIRDIENSITILTPSP